MGFPFALARRPQRGLTSKTPEPFSKSNGKELLHHGYFKNYLSLKTIPSIFLYILYRKKVTINALILLTFWFVFSGPNSLEWGRGREV